MRWQNARTRHGPSPRATTFADARRAASGLQSRPRSRAPSQEPVSCFRPPRRSIRTGVGNGWSPHRRPADLLVAPVAVYRALRDRAATGGALTIREPIAVARTPFTAFAGAASTYSLAYPQLAPLESPTAVGGPAQPTLSSRGESSASEAVPELSPCCDARTECRCCAD
jgi:hypothetical protein